ncbi:MAG TPA: GIY-YIG nuclease family protein [Leptospiraceae bacterium]|nr:GIY-YIG nuclease family protein [Leptospiraceae bacterium]
MRETKFIDTHTGKIYEVLDSKQAKKLVSELKIPKYETFRDRFLTGAIILYLGRYMLLSRWEEKQRQEKLIEESKQKEFSFTILNNNLRLTDAYLVDEISVQKLGTKKGIYALIETSTLKCYIGSSNLFCRRWQEHVDKLQKNNHENSFLQNAWNKYGKSSFVFFILKELDTEDQVEILKEEQIYLNELFKFPKDQVLNLATIAGTGNSNPGNLDKVRQIEIETGNVVQIFDSITSAAKALNKYLADGEPMSSNIAEVCKGNAYSAFGFKWEYDDRGLNSIYPRKDPPGTPKSHKAIAMLDEHGNIKRKFGSIAEAAREMKINSSAVSIAVNKKDYKKTKGIVFVQV